MTQTNRWMKAAPLIAFCLLALPALAAAGDKTPYGPVAQLPESHYEFKTALEGDTVTHVFAIRNIGSQELKIEKVRTG
jgi:hypothetical protein